MSRAKRSGRKAVGQGLGALGKALVWQEVVYALVCKQENDSAVRESELAEWQMGKRVGSCGSASRLTQTAREYVCGRK